MFRPYELYIGLRYTRAKRRNHFISFISLTSMLGIALGVTALITVLSVMSGFENELRERILGMAAHATVSGPGGKLRDWPGVVERVEAHPRVLGAAPYIQAQAMLTHSGSVQGAVIRGILPEQEPKVSEVSTKMKSGSLDRLQAGSFNVVLGRDLASSLGVHTGDKVTLIAPQAKVTPAGVMPRLRRFTVVGLFEVGMYEYDSALALVHMQDAGRLFRVRDAVNGVRIKVDELYAAPSIGRELGRQLGDDHWVTNWTQSHVNFFRAIRTEKTVMFVILTLIVAVAAFNIVSTLVMVVTDKKSEIAILRTLGASPRSIMLVFMVQGTLIGLVGTLLGVLGGVSLALNVETLVPAIEQFFGVQFMSPDVYYISRVPSKLDWSDVLNISMVAFALSIVATIYPALRAARTQPAEALRYE